MKPTTQAATGSAQLGMPEGRAVALGRASGVVIDADGIGRDGFTGIVGVSSRERAGAGFGAGGAAGMAGADFTGAAKTCWHLGQRTFALGS